jgi:hypothetical protein
MQDHWARYDFFDAQRTLGLCLAGKLILILEQFLAVALIFCS